MKWGRLFKVFPLQELKSKQNNSKWNHFLDNLEKRGVKQDLYVYSLALRAVSRAYFGHIGATEMLDSFTTNDSL